MVSVVLEVERELGSGLVVLIVRGDALARIAQSMEIKRIVLGDGPRGPDDVPGRLTVRLEELSEDFSLCEKRELDIRNGMDFAASGFASEVPFPTNPRLSGETPPLTGEIPMITSPEPLFPPFPFPASRPSDLNCCHGLTCLYQTYWDTKAISTVT